MHILSTQLLFELNLVTVSPMYVLVKPNSVTWKVLSLYGACIHVNCGHRIWRWAWCPLTL